MADNIVFFVYFGFPDQTRVIEYGGGGCSNYESGIFKISVCIGLIYTHVHYSIF